MERIKKVLPLFAVIAVVVLFTDRDFRSHPIGFTFFLFLGTLVIAWVLSLIYFLIVSKAYNSVNIFQLKFKHFFMATFIILSLGVGFSPNAKDDAGPVSSKIEGNTNKETEGGWVSHQNDEKTYACPHCNGQGQRLN